MKIIFVDNKKTGCYLVRTKVPGDALEKLGHTVEVMIGGDIQPADWDIVVFNRNVEKTKAEEVAETNKIIKSVGARIVFDTDDALDIVPEFNMAHKATSKALGTYYQLLRDADLVTTTTPTLAERLRSRASGQVVVLPNCLDPEMWPVRKGGNKKTRIGFAGSNSHVKDLMIAVDVLADLQNDYDFDFYIFGLSAVDLDEWFEQNKEKIPMFERTSFGAAFMTLYRSLKKIKNLTLVPAVPVEQYPARLAELNFDIGICPLEDSKFNANKSCIKFYEYAMVGTAVLTSRVLPYSVEVDYTAKNKFSDWRAKLEKLLKDQAFREDLAARQKEWVLANRDINKSVLEREKILKSIL